MKERELTSIPQEERLGDQEQLSEIAEKRREEIHSKLEEAEKQHHERQNEQEVLAKATELAKKAENKKDEEDAPAPHERRRGAPAKKQLRESFDSEMKAVQAELSPASSLFSKLIHAYPVEKASEVIGSTIARPNALLSGSIMAFLAITALYFLAHYFGYRLSGSETIAAFCIGWIIGIIYDYVYRLFRGRRP